MPIRLSSGRPRFSIARVSLADAPYRLVGPYLASGIALTLDDTSSLRSPAICGPFTDRTRGAADDRHRPAPDAWRRAASLRCCDEAGTRSRMTIRCAHRVRSEGRGRSDYEMKQESVIFIFVVFVLLLLSPSCLRRRATCVRHRLERGSGSRHPWSVSAIERCSVAAHASRIGCSHAAGIRPRRQNCWSGTKRDGSPSTLRNCRCY
jgi:hypothetical protein